MQCSVQTALSLSANEHILHLGSNLQTFIAYSWRPVFLSTTELKTLALWKIGCHSITCNTGFVS